MCKEGDFKITLSVIMPVYNVADYIEKAVNSVLGQTYRNIELILVDDGSTDSSGEICQRLAQSDSRVRLIVKKNQGVSSARNTGLSIATGEYVAFLDSDDWLEEDAYEQMLVYMQETNADIGVMGYIVESENGTINQLLKEEKQVMCAEVAVNKLISWEVYGWTVWDKIFRRDILCGMSWATDIVNGEDLLFNWQVFHRAKKIAYIPLWGYHYVQRDGSMMHSFTVGRLTVMKAFTNVLNDCEDEEIRKKVTEKYILAILGIMYDYFSLDNCNYWKFEFRELNDARLFLRQNYKEVVAKKVGIRQVMNLWMFMMPVPIIVLLFKLRRGMKEMGFCLKIDNLFHERL